MKGLLSRWFGSRRQVRKPARTRLNLEVLEDRLTPSANILVSADGAYPQQLFKEFTPTGQLVRSLPIPPGGAQEDARDLVADPQGNVLVYNGTNTAYLTTYKSSTGTWTQQPYPGWSTTNNPSYGGIGLWGNRVFASDMSTSGAGSPKGIVWFDRNTGATGRFATNFNPITLNVGKDGMLYAMDTWGTIDVFNPQTLALQRVITLPSTINGATQWYSGIAVNAAGDIFAATSSNRMVYRFNANGQLQNSVAVPGPGGFFGWLADIDVSGDGRIALGTTSGHVVQMTEAFTNVSYFTAGSSNVFVAFASDAPPPPPTVNISNATVTEGNSGTTLANFTVWLSSAVSFPVTANYATFDNTATAGSDYIATSVSLTFNPGETTKTFSVPVLGDTKYEPEESFKVILTSGSGVPPGQWQGIGTIVNDDPVPSLAVNNTSVVEGNSGTVNAVFSVNLSNPSSQTITVNYATSNVTASAGADYTAASGTLTFAPGETSKTVSVAVMGDVIAENDESFWLKLSGPVNATLATSIGTGTIVNDDLATLAVNDVSLPEGDSGSTNAAFTIALSTPSSFTVSVNWATADGTATADSDYTAASGTVFFAPGETTKTVLLPVLSDTIYEPDETFTVNLSGAAFATISRSQGIGTILNDDPLVPALSISDVSLAEGNSGATSITFSVSLSVAASQPVSVDWATANGSADTSDYFPASGTLTFSPGETAKTISVTVFGDPTYELDEAFFVNLANANNATIADSQGVGTIVNDDALPLLSIGDAIVGEGNTGSVNAVFTLSLSAPSSLPVLVNYSVNAGTATESSDYIPSFGSVTFAPGETTKTVSVAVLGDSIDETNETFTVDIGSPNATVTDSSGLGTIVDNDTALLSVDDIAVVEGNSGTTTAGFTVSLSSASDHALTVNWATGSGTALAGSDYTSATGTLTFNPGETSKTVPITVLADLYYEVDETFKLNLFGGVNNGFSDTQGIGTIQNDDALVSISINDLLVNEGNAGPVPAVFTLALSQASTNVITVNFQTSDQGASAGTDYIATSGTVTFNPGETTKTVTVQVLGDTAVEPNESFRLVLTNLSGGAVYDDFQGTATIVDDDGDPNLRAVSFGVARAYGSSTTFTELAVGQDLNVQWFSAAAPTDPREQRSMLEFDTRSIDPASTGSIHLDVYINGYLAGTPFVQVLGYAGDGTVTLDDATRSTVFLGAFNPTIAMGWRSIELDRTAVLSLVGSSTYVGLRFEGAAGTTCWTSMFSPQIYNPPKLVFPLGSAPTVPTVSIGDISIQEGNTGSGTYVNMVFTVTLSQPTTAPVTFTYQTADGTALAGSDYVKAQGVLAFNPGETQKTITIRVYADTTHEPDESFSLRLTNVANATIDRRLALGIILNDDPL